MAVHRIELADLLAERQHAGSVDLASRRRVFTDLAGTHLSGFRGRGMEFEEHRRYVPGDEIRSIDWRVTARTGHTHVRNYREERERPVILACDLRAPMWFGSRGCFKAVLAARVAARFAWAASTNGDRVGGLCLHHSHSESRPASGQRGVMRFFRLLCDAPVAAHPVPPLHQMVDELRRVARPGALIIVLSDFHDLDSPARQGLSMIGRHCELVLGLISDPLERHAPRPGIYPTRDHDGKTASLNARNTQTRQRWAAQFEEREQQLRALAYACRAQCLDLRTENNIDQAFGARRPRRAG